VRLGVAIAASATGRMLATEPRGPSHMLENVARDRGAVEETRPTGAAFRAQSRPREWPGLGVRPGRTVPGRIETYRIATMV
jgi:hypothetical protein